MSLFQIVRGDDLILSTPLTEDGEAVDLATVFEAWFDLRTTPTALTAAWSGSIGGSEIAKSGSNLVITIPDSATKDFVNSGVSQTDRDTGFPIFPLYGFLKIKKSDGTLSHALWAEKLTFVDSPLRTET